MAVQRTHNGHQINWKATQNPKNLNSNACAARVGPCNATAASSIIHQHTRVHTQFPPLPFQRLLWNVWGEMNLFIHSVTPLSISVCDGVSSNSESFYTTSLTVSQFSEKKIVVEVHLSFCAQKIWSILTPIFFFFLCFQWKRIPLYFCWGQKV